MSRLRGGFGVRPGAGGGGTTIRDWATLTAGTPGERIPVMVDGELCVAEMGSVLWSLEAPSTSAQAYAAANVRPEGAGFPVAGLWGIRMPGGIEPWTNTEGATARLCRMSVPGGGSFSRIRLTGISGGSNSGVGTDDPAPGYSITAAYIGRTGATTLTEDIETGFVTIFDDGRAVPAGARRRSPVFADLTPGGFDCGGLITGSFQLVVELPVGAELRLWGLPYEAPGWIGTDNAHVLATLPSSGTFTLAGVSPSFGQMPNVAIEFLDLDAPTCCPLLIGDSHIRPFGDGDSIMGRRGLASRWEAAWAGDDRRWAACQIGIPGHPTPDILSLYQAVSAYFPFRLAIYEAISVNNYNEGFAYPDPGARAIADLATARTVMPTQPLIPLIAGTWNIISGDAGRRANYRAAIDAVVAADTTTLNQADGALFDSTSLEYLPGLGYADGGHPNTAGYDAWATATQTAVTSRLEALGA